MYKILLFILITINTMASFSIDLKIGADSPETKNFDLNISSRQRSEESSAKLLSMRYQITSKSFHYYLGLGYGEDTYNFLKIGQQGKNCVDVKCAKWKGTNNFIFTDFGAKFFPMNNSLFIGMDILIGRGKLIFSGDQNPEQTYSNSLTYGLCVFAGKSTSIFSLTLDAYLGLNILKMEIGNFKYNSEEFKNNDFKEHTKILVGVTFY